jgi:hypothetical protein
VDLVDEQNVVRLKIGQQRRQIAGTLQHRAAGLAQVDAQFAGNDVRQRGFTQAGWAEQQHVVKRLAALLRRFDKNLQLATGFFLADVFVENFRPQCAFQRFFLRGETTRGGPGCGQAKSSVWMPIQ